MVFGNIVLNLKKYKGEKTMTRFQGFATKEEAVKHQKKHGGLLCGKEAKHKYARRDYEIVIMATGLDPEKYPWVLQWGNQ